LARILLYVLNDPEPTWAELKSRTATVRAILSVGRTKHGRNRAVNRREVITLLGGTAAAWPLAAWAQQGERMRRIAVLGGGTDREISDPRSQPNTAAFLQTLQQLGWTDGRNVRIDYRWPAADADKARKYAAELVALAPDVILAVSPTSLVPLLQATRTLPIVFVAVSDPVGAGFVDSLARPGGNATGFMVFEYDLSGKWLELLKEIVPGVTRAAVLRDSATPTGIGQFAVIQSVSRSVGVEVSPLNLPDGGEIEPALATFARRGNSGLIVTASSLSLVHRELIVALAARHKLPAVYWERPFVAAGGLISYGPDRVDQFRQAAGYVDRTLKGEKPADLPVQAPTKYELVINLKTAKALGLTVSDALVVRADEVIE
jgi:putative ABC transport system substrate-binding protein